MLGKQFVAKQHATVATCNSGNYMCLSLFHTGKAIPYDSLKINLCRGCTLQPVSAGRHVAATLRVVQAAPMLQHHIYALLQQGPTTRAFIICSAAALKVDGGLTIHPVSVNTANCVTAKYLMTRAGKGLSN